MIKRLPAALLMVVMLLAIAPAAQAARPDGSASPEPTASGVADTQANSGIGVCDVVGEIYHVSRFVLGGAGWQNCKSLGVYVWSNHITVNLDRCTFEFFGNCITWSQHGQMGPTCSYFSAGPSWCPAYSNYRATVPAGRYKVRVQASVDTSSGHFSGADESGSIVIS